MKNISDRLSKVMDHCGDLQLYYDYNDKSFSIPYYFHGKQGYYLSFDPWNGCELRCTYDYELVEIYKNSIKIEKELWHKYRRTYHWENCRLHRKELREFLNKFGPISSPKSRKWQDSRIQYDRNSHLTKNICDNLSPFLKGGEREGKVPIIHIPNVRIYAILNKKKGGGFESMDYCPFCGAKFSRRLDEELTKVLQIEYDLKSWKDYKKAPAEFHSDEWWKKRGL
jgi:hypothetical protein